MDYYLRYADVGEGADKRDYVVLYKKITRRGYRTAITLEEGIDELVRGFQVLDVCNPYVNV